jgi:ankyrin repeat protein
MDTTMKQWARAAFLRMVQDQNVGALKALPASDKIAVNMVTKKTGQTPLLIAIEKKNVDLVRLLLERYRVVVNQTCRSERQAPLIAAIGTGSVEIVRLLLQHGADANIMPSESYLGGLTPLTLLFSFGPSQLHLTREQALTVAELLLTNGANPNLAKRDGYAPIHFSCGNVDRLELLHKYGADLNLLNPAKDYTALLLSITDSAPGATLWLLKNGAAPSCNIVDIHGHCPLSEAIHYWKPDTSVDVLELLWSETTSPVAMWSVLQRTIEDLNESAFFRAFETVGFVDISRLYWVLSYHVEKLHSDDDDDSDSDTDTDTHDILRSISTIWRRVFELAIPHDFEEVLEFTGECDHLNASWMHNTMLDAAFHRRKYALGARTLS